MAKLSRRVALLSGASLATASFVRFPGDAAQFETRVAGPGLLAVADRVVRWVQLDTATATDLPLPVAFNGVIEKDGDEDWFRFKAKKGDNYEIRAYARAVRSPCTTFWYRDSASGLM